MDNRIKFPATAIDFSEVGVTGQDHDNYPAGSQQARYDWMRMVIIGLLSCQSSAIEPTQYRDGTWWFDLSTLSMKIRVGEAWEPAAKVLALAEGVSLYEFYQDYLALKQRVIILEQRAGI